MPTKPLEEDAIKLDRKNVDQREVALDAWNSAVGDVMSNAADREDVLKRTELNVRGATNNCSEICPLNVNIPECGDLKMVGQFI